MHWLVPLRQALAVTVWPSVSGPTVRDLAAMPLELVVTAPRLEGDAAAGSLPGDGLAAEGMAVVQRPGPALSR